MISISPLILGVFAFASISTVSITTSPLIGMFVFELTSTSPLILGLLCWYQRHHLFVSFALVSTPMSTSPLPLILGVFTWHQHQYHNFPLVFLH